MRTAAIEVEVEDVLQETYLRAWRGRTQFASRDPDSFLSWTLAIARRVAAESLRRVARVTPLNAEHPRAHLQPRAAPEDPAEIAETRECFRDLEEVLERRGEEFPIVSALFRLGDDVETIARALDLHTATVRRHLLRELAELRTLLASSRDARRSDG